jgi:CRISPR/Cas system CMR subunit Cmr6 (Cas7 group RAMP superfamily)
MLVRIKALSPICHGGFGPSVGNAVRIRRESVMVGGDVTDVPCISGNSIRGICRRIVFGSLFDYAGMTVGCMEGKRWDKLYAALCNGGHLTGREKTPSPEQLRDLRSSLPPLSVFGSALYSFLLPGRVRFGFAWPVCEQTVAAGLISSRFSQTQAEDVISETGITRHIDREMQDPKTTGVTPMPLSIDTISPGTELECSVEFEWANEVEESCIAFALDRVKVVGGKVGSGFGAVSLSHDGNPSPYVEWLSDSGADVIRSRLLELAETL